MIGWALSKTCGQALSFLYPAYASFKAIETKNVDDDSQWLTYWIVIGFFAVIEDITDVVISWLPFYWEAKLLLVLWMQLPQFQGARYVYQQFLRPFLKQNEKKIDAALDEAQDMVRDKTKRLSKQGMEYAMKHLQSENEGNPDKID